MHDTWNAPSLLTNRQFQWLVIYIRNYHWLNSASWVLVKMREHKQFSLFDLDLWPTTLTYNPRLAKVKVDPHAKYQGQRSNGSNRRVPTDKRTDTRTLQTYYRPCYAVDKNRCRDEDPDWAYRSRGKVQDRISAEEIAGKYLTAKKMKTRLQLER